MPSDKIDKKRKRASERQERPTKKTALQTLPTLAASVVEDKSELAPVIGMYKLTRSSWLQPLIYILYDSYYSRCSQLQGPPLQSIHQKPPGC